MMADQEAPEGQDVENTDESPQVEGQEPKNNGDDSPYAPLAKDLGWVSRDEFHGPAEKWKDPETFIRDGRDIQRETSRELTAVRSQLDTIAKTNAFIVQQQVDERVNQLTAQHAKAVEDGDPAEAFKISRAIDTTLASAQPAKVLSPEAQAFAERNSSWYEKPGNEYATARAVEICDMLFKQGYTDHATQLRIAEQRLRHEMPQLFGQNGTKPAPGVHAPGSRAAGPSNRQKSWADMPLESQKALEPLIERNPTITKEQIARNYFANLEGKA